MRMNRTVSIVKAPFPAWLLILAGWIIVLSAPCRLASQDLHEADQAEESVHSLRAAMGLASFRHVDHSLSALHYRGTLKPLYLEYRRRKSGAVQAWSLHLERADLESVTDNSRSYSYFSVAYRNLRLLSSPAAAGTKIRIYAGGGISGAFARLKQSIVLPTYRSNYDSGYAFAGADLALMAETDPLSPFGITYRLNMPVFAYLVKPEYSRRWPGPEEGKLAGPTSLFEIRQRLELRYRLGRAAEAGVEAFYLLNNMKNTWKQASAGKGLLLTLRIYP